MGGKRVIGLWLIERTGKGGYVDGAGVNSVSDMWSIKKVEANLETC